MSAARAERLVNLVICLLSTRAFLTAERIRTAVPGYAAEDGTALGEEAFKRMFERDKVELRDLGVPLETGRNGWGDTEDGYRIARRDYELPEIDLAPDEAAAVGLAARLWQSAGLSEDAHGALRKLRAAGIDVDPHATPGIQPRVEAADRAFDPCLAAVRARRPIRFGYQRPEAAEPGLREIEPWGVVSWKGRWYVVGHDRDRKAPRCFRMSRIVGRIESAGRPGTVVVPEGVDLTALVATTWQQSGMRTATVAIAPGRAAGLRRVGRATGENGPDGEEFTLDYGDPGSLADRLIGYGDGVLVLAPPEVRDAVVTRLRVLVGG
ncbi:MAG: WYL domain-containing protein [Geodermatophilaceae bacterium]|nr:WYL domain-containing protein [Geodermatophilaceae bacterium]